MVRGCAMDSQDKRMCKDEPSFFGVTDDYNNNHRVYDEDCFGDILNIFDFPMESLEGDGLAEDWALKLGPIPLEVFRELLPPVPGGGSSTDLPFEYPILKPNLPEEQNRFNASSPNSVLETHTSSSNNKTISFEPQLTIPVRTRTKRIRPTTNPWLTVTSPWLTITPNDDNKQKKLAQVPVNMETKKLSSSRAKKCAHCEITKTPQWREGPMGPGTLCNACGVRYRLGRLYPEYRPMASPTFEPSLHSNSHRKVIMMREKGVKHTEWF